MRAVALSLRHELIGLAGRGRAERLPHPALHLLGRRVLRLDRREHADDRLHRRGDRGSRRSDRRRAGDDDAADRRRRLGVSRDHLRVPHRDGRLGALGGDDRVHVHGTALTRDAPRRLGCLRRALRAHPGDPALRRRRRVLRARVRRRELRRRARRARRRLDLVLRDRDDDRRPAADLAGEGCAARVRRPGDAARRLGCLLPGGGAAAVDAVARDDLARDVRPRRESAPRSSTVPR